MKITHSRSISLLLIIVMVLSTTVTGFADEVPSEDKDKAKTEQKVEEKAEEKEEPKEEKKTVIPEAPKPAPTPSPDDDIAAIAFALYLASCNAKHDAPTSMIKPQARETAWNTKSIGMNNQGF